MQKSINLNENDKSAFVPYKSLKIARIPNLTIECDRDFRIENKEQLIHQNNNDDVTVNYYFSIVFNSNSCASPNEKPVVRSKILPDPIIFDKKNPTDTFDSRTTFQSSIVKNFKLNTNNNNVITSTLKSNISKPALPNYTTEDSNDKENTASVISLPSGNIRNPKFNNYKSQQQAKNMQRIEPSKIKKSNYFSRSIYLPSSRTNAEKVYISSFKPKIADDLEDLGKSSGTSLGSYYGDKENDTLASEDEQTSEVSSFLDDEEEIPSEAETVIEHTNAETSNSFDPYSLSSKGLTDPYVPSKTISELNTELLSNLNPYELNSGLTEDQKNFIIKQLSEVAKSRASVEKKSNKIVNSF